MKKMKRLYIFLKNQEKRHIFKCCSQIGFEFEDLQGNTSKEGFHKRWFFQVNIFYVKNEKNITVVEHDFESGNSKPQWISIIH